MEVHVKWDEGMQFTAETASGHKVVMDASVEAGGLDQGPRPTELVLAGLGGCTGIDIVSILQKMQQPVKSVRMRITGERAEDHPRRFTKIHLKYIVAGAGLSEDRVARAVQLSVEKYCSVAHSLNAKISYSFEIEKA